MLRESLGEHTRIRAHLEPLTERERVMEKMNAQSVAELVRMMMDIRHVAESR